jgi:hypothetical protein
VAAVTTPSSASYTDGLCATAVPAGYEFYNSQASTVGEIRHFTGGPAPGSRLWPDAFPASADADAAVWCRGTDGVSSYVAYVVTADGVSEVLGYETGITSPPPPGPPRIE